MQLRAILLGLFLCNLVRGHELTGRVVAIQDGDTITVLGPDHTQNKVRLMGIDAPEKKQAFGTKAKDAMAERVFEKTVTISYGKTDRYGRLLGRVLLGTRDIGREMIETGMAWHYKQYAKEQSAADRDAYGAAEVAARTRRAGLWTDSEPVAPWAFRRARRQAPAVARP